MSPSAAATVLQKYIRRYLTHKKADIKALAIGQTKAITNVHLKLRNPSLVFGPAALSLDLDKTHEIMVTRVKVSEVDVALVTNQGKPDSLQKYLKSSDANYGAAINGGFYAHEGFYGLKWSSPIGIHRFKVNYRSPSKRYYGILKDFDNTANYFMHKDDEISKPNEDYIDKDIESQLHLKTQTPYSVRSEYGIVRITHAGTVDIEKLASFTDNTFKDYLEQAKYLLSSGPFLVWNSEIVFTEEKLQDKKYQFEQVFKHFGKHPGSVPPGTFYHANQCNPRSALALNKAGELLMVTVKGDENPDKRDGMTLPQFAKLLKLLGADKALNLDGGYSSFQGVFDESKMFTPTFVKMSGQEQYLPCAIVAKQKPKAPTI